MRNSMFWKPKLSYLVQMMAHLLRALAKQNFQSLKNIFLDFVVFILLKAARQRRSDFNRIFPNTI